MRNLLRWLDPILNPEACLPPMTPTVVEEENADALLKRLDLLLKQQVRFALSGERRSKLKGQGLDFSGLREYTPGDDIRKMDWSVFARTLSPYVREYQEEKQLTLWLAVDLTPSMHFGRDKTKARQAIELAGLMGLLAQKSHHKLGALILLGNESRIIPPKTGPAQIQYLMHALLEALNPTKNEAQKDARDQSVSKEEPLLTACQKLTNLVQKQHTILFLSDFMAQDTAWYNSLGELSRRAQLLCMMLTDPIETELPAGLGLLNLQDAETGQILQIDTNDHEGLAQYSQASKTRQDKTLGLLKDLGITALASTESEATRCLLTLFTGPRTKLRGQDYA